MVEVVWLGTRFCWWDIEVAFSCGRHRPSVGGMSQSEYSETRQIVGGGEEVEVGVDFGLASYPGSPPAVAAAHQVADFAFDFGSGGPVVGFPAGILLLTPSSGETVFVTADTNAASVFGVGAL